MRNTRNNFLLLMIGVVLLNSCKKKFDEPAVKMPPSVSSIISIDSVYKKYYSYYKLSIPNPTVLFKFPDDANLECIVTADETSGNIYKTVYVADATGGLQIKLMTKGGLYVGDKIRINLKGAVLNDYGDVVQLDSIDIDKRVVKINSGNPVVPIKLTFNQFIQMNGEGHTPFQSQLIQLDSVEFATGDKNQLYADPVGRYSLDRVLLNSLGQQVIVRTSGYALFAGNSIPCGKGSIVAIAGQYNSDIQLTIRDYKEIKLANNGCPLLIKSFNDGSIASGGWINYNVSGNINWKPGNYNGQAYGQISNYSFGSNIACESWLISPSLDLSSSPNPRFSFQSAFNYSGPALEVLVSTNYISGDPNSATWTNLSPNLSGGSWNWIYSGLISLSPYKSSNTRLAFKYTGTSSAGSTWEIDDIAVFGE